MNRRLGNFLATKAPRRAAGYTFTEVMFAVMILGIGFIMVAAIFPVAIQQTQEVVDDAAAGAVAQSAFEVLQDIATRDNLPPTVISDSSGALVPNNAHGRVLPFRQQLSIEPNTGQVVTIQHPLLWERVRGSLIHSADPRYAWIPFYRRGVNCNFAQMFVIVVRNRNQSAYEFDRDALRQNGKMPPRDNYFVEPPASLEPRQVRATFQEGGGAMSADTVTLYLPQVTGNIASEVEAAAEGAFLIVSDDHFQGSCNGQVFRLGMLLEERTNQNPVVKRYELAPGNDMKGLKEKPTNPRPPSPWVDVLLVGRGWSNPRSPGGYEGLAQDVAVFKRYIPLK